MARTKYPSDPRRKKAHDRTIQQVRNNEKYANSLEQEKANKRREKELAWRRKHGKKNCPHNLGGYGHDLEMCQECRDSEICEKDTPKQILSAAYHLGKLGYPYNSELWASDNLQDPDLFNTKDERDKIVYFALELRERIDSDPILISKIKALPSITNRFLTQHVPGWKRFLHDVAKKKPRLIPEQALSRLAEIWNDFAEGVKERANCDDPLEALWMLLEDQRYKQDRKTILTPIGKQLSEYVEAFYNTFLVKKDDGPLWPKGWMEDDKKGIKVMMEKRKHFIPLMNYLCECQLGPQESDELMERRGIEPYEAGENKVRRTYILIHNLDFEIMGKQLDLKPDPLRKHLQEMERMGILKKFGKDGPRGQLIYALGYWLPVPNRPFPTPVYFLKDTPQMKKALRDFNPYRTKSQKL